MQTITGLRKKLPNGQWTEEIPIGAAASNISYNGKKLTDIIGNIDELQGISIVDSIKKLSDQSKPKEIFTKDITINDSNWSEKNNKYQYTIPLNEHNFKYIYEIELFNLNNDNIYENVDFSYKVYTSRNVVIILDLKINGKIIIQGEGE